MTYPVDFAPMPQQEIDADQAVQEILNAWGAIRTSPETHPLNADFSALFDKMQAYRTAKGIADNRRAHHKLTKQAAVQEKVTKQEFVAAYLSFMRQK